MLSRRAFIRISCLFPLAFELEAREVPAHTVEIRDVLMGTFVQIKGVGVRREVLSGAVSQMKKLEHHFSRFDKGSELSLFNREGAVRRPSREFRTVMEAAREGYSLTGGTFDVTVLPVLRHFEKYRRLPGDRERDRYRRLMGADRIEIDHDLVYSAARAQVTLDGIATGYIVDRAVNWLAESGSLTTLVNAGGDIYCGPKKGGWEIGVYDPFQDAILRKLRVERMAVCTSGNYVNFYTEDRRLHHIIDPRSLSSPQHLTSVTVTASTTCRADLLSTALFVAGPAGRRFLREGERAYFLTKDGTETAA